MDIVSWRHVNSTFQTDATQHMGSHLRTQVEGRSNTTSVHQSGDLPHVLEKFEMDVSRMASTPMPKSMENLVETVFSIGMGQKDGPRFPYMRSMGSLLHMNSRTIPSTKCSVNILGLDRIKKNLGQSHRRTLKFLLRCLRETVDHGVLIGSV